MFHRLSADARDAFGAGQEESARLGHPWLGTEHVLLAMLRRPETAAAQILAAFGVTAATFEMALIEELGEPSGVDVLGEADEEALRTLGIDLQAVRSRADETFGPGALDRARAGRCGTPMMPRLKQSLELAVRAAGPRRSIETDDVLLGMMQVRGSLAGIVLRRVGVSPDRVQAAVREFRARAS